MAYQANWHDRQARCATMWHFKCRAVTVGEKSFGKVGSLQSCLTCFRKDATVGYSCAGSGAILLPQQGWQRPQADCGQVLEPCQV